MSGSEVSEGSAGKAGRQCPVCGRFLQDRYTACPDCRFDPVGVELDRIAYTSWFLGWALERAGITDEARARVEGELERRRSWLASLRLQPAARAAAPATPAAQAAQRVPSAAQPPGWRTAAPPPPRAPSPWVLSLRRAWSAVVADFGVHGLAYLGVLLLFAGTLGLVVFALRDVYASLRPLAEVAVPVVLFGSAVFLRRQRAPFVADSLELLGGALTPVVLFASVRDGAGVPPDPGSEALLVGVLAAMALGLAGLYALAARWRPSSSLRYLVGPLLWTAVGVVGLAVDSGVSAAQMALVAAAITATAAVTGRRLADPLARPTEVAAIPAALVVFAFALLLPPGRAPILPLLAVGLATLVSLELLGGRLGNVAVLACLVLGLTLARVAPSLGPARGGTLATIAFIALLEWQAARRPSQPARILALTGAGAGLLAVLTGLVTADAAGPWATVAAYGLAAAWAHARRLLGPPVVPAVWLDVAAAVLPLGLAAGLLETLSPGPALVLLGGLVAVAALAVRRWRPADGFLGWYVPAAAALVALGTVPERASASGAWFAAAAALAGVALAVASRPAAQRVWGTAAAFAWALTLAFDTAGVPGSGRVLAWSLAGFVLVAAATARYRRQLSGLVEHVAAVGHLAGLGAVLAATPRGPAGTTALGAWVAAWLLTVAAAEAGRAPLVGLLTRHARGEPRLALGVAALPAVVAAASLPVLLVWMGELTGLLAGERARVGVALAGTALTYGLAVWPLAGRRPLAPVLGTAGIVLAGVAIAVAAPVPWPTIGAVAAAIAVLALVGSALRWPVTAWPAWALSGVLALLLAGRAGVPIDRLYVVLGGWGALLVAGGLALDDLLAGRRQPGEWLRRGWLVPPAGLGALGVPVALAFAFTDQAAMVAGSCLSGAAFYLVVALQLRAGGVSGATYALGTVGLVALGPEHASARPWLAVPLVAALAGLSWVFRRDDRAGDLWLGWDLAPLVVGHVLAAVALAWAPTVDQVPLTWAGLGAVSLALAAWLRGWPWAAAGTSLVLVAAGAAGPGWLALALAATAVGTGLAARVLGLGWLRLAAAVSAAGAGQSALWAARAPAGRWVAVTLAAGLLVTLGALARWRHRPLLPAGGSPLDEAPWLAPALLLGGLWSAAGLLVPLVVEVGDAQRELLAAGLLVAAAQAAATGLLLRLAGVLRLAPILACGAWLLYAAETFARGGDPQLVTLPLGVTLLVEVEMARWSRRRAGEPLVTPELLLLEYLSIALVAGVGLTRIVTHGPAVGLLAVLVGVALGVWGALTRVRRRLAAGAAVCLLAVFLVVAVPLAGLIPRFEGAALWLALAAIGLAFLLVATSLERGRARLASATSRIDRLLEGWE